MFLLSPNIHARLNTNMLLVIFLNFLAAASTYIDYPAFDSYVRICTCTQYTMYDRICSVRGRLQKDTRAENELATADGDAERSLEVCV